MLVFSFVCSLSSLRFLQKHKSRSDFHEIFLHLFHSAISHHFKSDGEVTVEIDAGHSMSSVSMSMKSDGDYTHSDIIILVSLAPYMKFRKI